MCIICLLCYLMPMGIYYIQMLNLTKSDTGISENIYVEKRGFDLSGIYLYNVLDYLSFVM